VRIRQEDLVGAPRTRLACEAIDRLPSWRGEYAEVSFQ
jgi:hypothetical protein